MPSLILQCSLPFSALTGPSGSALLGRLQQSVVEWLLGVRMMSCLAIEAKKDDFIYLFPLMFILGVKSGPKHF